MEAPEPSSRLLATTCCAKPICQDCLLSDQRRCHLPVCPYCRHAQYSAVARDDWNEVAEQQQEGDAGTLSLDGDWEVEITEKSPLGSITHKVNLAISGSSGVFVDSKAYFNGSRWASLNPTGGGAFEAQQLIISLPHWLQQSSARICRQGGVEGKIYDDGRRASYCSVLTLSDKRGNLMDLEHHAVMTRRRERRRLTL